MYSTSTDQRVGDLVDKDIMTVDESALISDSVRMMKNKGLSSLFVTSSGNKNAHSPNFPIGIVTERDILYNTTNNEFSSDLDRRAVNSKRYYKTDEREEY
jgi:predicted transcriptional regulator